MTGAANSNRDPDHTEITVETLSSPPVRVEPAPVAQRLAATIVDTLLLGLVWLILGSTSGAPPFEANFGNDWFRYALFAAIVFLYYFLSEWWFAASVGKFLFKLRVYLRNGDVCDMESSLKRNVLRFVDWLPVLYLIGGATIAVTKDRIRLGDVLAGTVVSRAPVKDINPPPAPFLFH